MIPSLTPGGKPSVSNRLADYLNRDDDEPVEVIEDEFDVLINRENLHISRFVAIRELDMALVVLNNRRIITQTLSAYPSLANASDEALNQYTISQMGIHWSALDSDLSLRGLLMSEMVKSFVLV
jgi:hypothetical protein